MLIADIVKPIVVQEHRDSRQEQVSRATLGTQDSRTNAFHKYAKPPSPGSRAQTKPQMTAIHQESVTKQESQRTPVAKQEPRSKSHAEPVSPSKATKQESRPNAFHKYAIPPSPSKNHTQEGASPTFKPQANHNPSPSKSHQARVTPNPCRQAKPPNKSHATHYHDRCLSLTL